VGAGAWALDNVIRRNRAAPTLVTRTA